MHQKCQPAGEAGSLASLKEYFGNLHLPAGRRSSCEKAQVGKQNGVIRGALKSESHPAYEFAKLDINGMMLPFEK